MTTPEVLPVEPDYKALLEVERAARAESDAAREKQARDYAALRGTVRGQVARDSEWAARFDTLSQQIATVAKVGDEGIQRETAEIHQRGQAQHAQAQFEAEWAPLEEELRAALFDPQGKPVLDLATAPELAEVRGVYREARETPGLSGEGRLRLLERAARLAERVVRAKPLPVKEPVKEPEPRKVPSMSTGPTAGAAVVSDEDYAREYGRSGMPFGKPPDHARVKKYQDSLGK